MLYLPRFYVHPLLYSKRIQVVYSLHTAKIDLLKDAIIFELFGKYQLTSLSKNIHQFTVSIIIFLDIIRLKIPALNAGITNNPIANSNPDVSATAPIIGGAIALRP